MSTRRAVADARAGARARLTHAYAEDLLDADELDERLEALENADTTDDIERLVADLDEPPATALVPTGGADLPAVIDGGSTRILSVFSEAQRRGAWTPGADNRVISVFGSTVIDLRDARLPELTRIHVKAAFASVEIYVPPGLFVDLRCTPILGTAEQDEPSVEVRTSGPRVLITGWIAFGSLEILERLPGERPRDARRRRKTARKQLAAGPARSLPPGD